MQGCLERGRRPLYYIFIILSLKIQECLGVSARLGLFCMRPSADREFMSSHRLCSFSLNIFFFFSESHSCCIELTAWKSHFIFKGVCFSPTVPGNESPKCSSTRRHIKDCKMKLSAFMVLSQFCDWLREGESARKEKCYSVFLNSGAGQNCRSLLLLPIPIFSNFKQTPS